MNAPQLLETLTACGAVVLMDGEVLVVKPRDVITNELRAEIRANKAALLELLSTPPFSVPLAHRILSHLRPTGGFTYSRALAADWKAANQQLNYDMNSAELAEWARDGVGFRSLSSGSKASQKN